MNFPTSISVRLRQQSENHVNTNIVDETESRKDDEITQQKLLVTASADQVMKMLELQFGLNLCFVNKTIYHPTIYLSEGKI